MQVQLKIKSTVNKEITMKDRLIRLIAQSMGIDEMDIDMKSNFMDDLGADSLDTVEIIIELEDEFGIEIPDDEVEKMFTVADVYNYLDNNVDDSVIR
jgi:acyl carrier protein